MAGTMLQQRGALLLEHIACLCTMDGERRVWKRKSGGGDEPAIAVRGDTIVCVGSREHCVSAFSEGEMYTCIDCTDMMAMPGMIDAHAHAGHGLVKTLGGCDSKAWYRACHAIYTLGNSVDFWEAEGELVALERLKAGVTTGVSLLGGGDSVFRTDDVEYGLAHVKAVERIGTRSVVAVGVNRPPLLVPIDEDTPRTQWLYGEKVVTMEEQIRVCRELIDRCHLKSKDKRIRFATVCPVHHPQGAVLPAGVTMDEINRGALAMRSLADEYEGVGFTQDGHGSGSIAYAHKLGLLRHDSYLSHCIDLLPEDVKALQATSASVVHNPSAIASIYGRCPVPELIELGINVALASDGTAPDRSCDMFRHMRQCMAIHRRHFKDTSYMPCGKVLEMVTTDAAKALDAPHLAPMDSMPIEHVINFANAADVDTVIIAGELLMQNRRVHGIDERAVVLRASEEARRAVARCGLEGSRTLHAGFWGRARYSDDELFS